VTNSVEIKNCERENKIPACVLIYISFKVHLCYSSFHYANGMVITFMIKVLVLSDKNILTKVLFGRLANKSTGNDKNINFVFSLFFRETA
jgi:hypothetical protein